MSEVTKDEILDKYDVRLKEEIVTSWIKELTLEDATGTKCEISLSWNPFDGYRITKSSAKLPEMDRPEFEYILDCIAEDYKFDRDNPWDMAYLIGDSE